MESQREMSTPSNGLISGSHKPRPLHGRTSGPTRRSTKGQWTAEEDEILGKAVERFKGKNWKKIAECFKDRTDVQCLHRWQKVLNPELVKGPWNKEEDGIIIELVNKYGPKKWSTIAQHLPGRIGKQCRERWHNHLNPAINKEAWTQEEELALIRAHQIYGNRWAELTKFLPGRTDNAIKNHWNSSVKKKMDSYIASGLLSQFPALPTPAGYQSQIAASSSRMQSSGNDAIPKGGAEAEEISECSQGSTMVVCSHSASDMVLHGRDDLQFLEESAIRNESNSSPASSSGQYYSIEEVTLSIPDINPETAHSSDLQMQFSRENETCAGQNHLHSDNLPNVSLLELLQESSVFPSCDLGTDGSHHRHNVPMDPMLTSSVGALGIDSDQLHHILISDEECCRILFSEAVGDGCLSSNLKGSDSSGFSGRPDSSSNQSSDIQISASCGALSQLYDHSRLDLVVTLGGQSSMRAATLSYDAEKINSDRKQNQLTDVPATAQEDFVNPHNGFVYTSEPANSPHDNGTELGTAELLDLPKDQPKLVPVSTFCSPSGATQACLKEDMNVKVEKEEPGFLCYEPPRFPSLDIPFLSCELIQSSSDMQMDYSPLGIRQLMMSSMNCISPLRLWDSPIRDSSPDAVLKNAAKTFTNTPSIVRKRNRDLLSPLSDRRIDKKLGTDIASNLSRDFSRLDVMFDEKSMDRISPPSPLPKQKMNSGLFKDDNKENLSIVLEAGGEKDDGNANSTERNPEKENERSASENKIEEGAGNSYPKCKLDAEADVSTESIQLPPEVLSEHDLNDLLSLPPDQTSKKTDKPLEVTGGTPRNMCSRIMATCSDPIDSSSGNSCPPISSPPVSRTCGISWKLASASKLCLHTLAPLEIVVNNDSNESLSIFDGTPFSRSIESPSAWKSPWFFNSFLPGPRIATEITIEDIGYFMSPGDRSYDALGLMKHVSEHNASVFANAEEVLGSETPKQKSINVGNLDQENQKPDQPTGTTSKASNVLIERRTLDFSECVTPGKSREKGKSSAASSFSSPSSYLLKGCR